MHGRYPNGESYLDVIQRLEPVIIELEREKESVLIVAHQAILRAIYGYFTNKPLGDIPTLEIPLHTVIELTPKADGTMTEERFFTGIPTTSKLYEMAAARYSAHDRLPRPPAAQTDQVAAAAMQSLSSMASFPSALTTCPPSCLLLV